MARLRLGLCDDGEQLDLRFCNVKKRLDVANSQAILRLAEASKSLDATLADFRRFVGQVHADGLDDTRQRFDTPLYS